MLSHMQEQASLFLVSLWSFAFVASTDRAAEIGWLYIGLRALYAPIWMIVGGEKGAPFPHLFISTFPQYAINFYMALTVVIGVATDGDTDLGDDIFQHDFVGVLVFTFVYMAYAVGLTPKLNMAFTGFFAAPDATPDATDAA